VKTWRDAGLMNAPFDNDGRAMKRFIEGDGAISEHAYFPATRGLYRGEIPVRAIEVFVENGFHRLGFDGMEPKPPEGGLTTRDADQDIHLRYLNRIQSAPPERGRSANIEKI